MTGVARSSARFPGDRPHWAEVNLAAVTQNVTSLRVFAGVSVVAVVKADAYGHGAVEVARAALEGGADRLAVALVEEGRELREAGIDAPILLLAEPPIASATAVIDAGLTPAIYTQPMADALAKSAAGMNAGPVNIHLKVDTGMHRLGASEKVACELARFVDGSPHLVLDGIWTHLAVADEPENPYTAEQISAFESACAAIEASGVRPRSRHVANSAGALYHPDALYSMVRIGIAIYGVPPSRGRSLPPGVELEPALEWKAQVSHTKQMRAGESVGYGLTYRLGADARIVTIPVGYADGYFRNLGNRAEVLINGRRLPVVGAVSMDHITVDVGDAEVGPGAEVVLLGRQGNESITAAELAERAGTIAYEVLARIGARVPRVYL